MQRSACFPLSPPGGAKPASQREKAAASRQSASGTIFSAEAAAAFAAR